MITFDPTELLKKYVPENKIKKLLTQKLTLNKTMLSMFSDMEFVTKKEMTNVVLKAVKQYKKKYAGLIKEDVPKTEAIAETLNEKKMLVNRVQDTVVFQISQSVKENYEGEYYKWLPSDAEIPDPLHQLKYGKTFQIGDGEQPGDRFGCRCGMEILTKEKNLVI